MRFGLAPHSGTFLLDAGAAKQRADKSSANAEPKASLLDELDKVNVPERLRANTIWSVMGAAFALPDFVVLFVLFSSAKGVTYHLEFAQCYAA